MKLNWHIPRDLQYYYLRELALYRTNWRMNHYRVAWTHLERAHIIAQKYPKEHTYVHWQMLLMGCRSKNSREIYGQILRLLVGGLKSFLDKVPVGNTGGANVPPLKHMPVPEDIQQLFLKCKSGKSLKWKA